MRRQLSRRPAAFLEEVFCHAFVRCAHAVEMCACSRTDLLIMRQGSTTSLCRSKSRLQGPMAEKLVHVDLNTTQRPHIPHDPRTRSPGHPPPPSSHRSHARSKARSLAQPHAAPNRDLKVRVSASRVLVLHLVAEDHGTELTSPTQPPPPHKWCNPASLPRTVRAAARIMLQSLQRSLYQGLSHAPWLAIFALTFLRIAVSTRPWRAETHRAGLFNEHFLSFAAQRVCDVVSWINRLQRFNTVLQDLTGQLPARPAR